MDRAQAGRVATSSSDVGFGFRSLLSSLTPGSPLGPAPFMTSLTPAPWGKGAALDQVKIDTYLAAGSPLQA